MSQIRRNPRFFTTIVRKRRSSGTYVSGEWVEGALEPDQSFLMSVQPASGRDLLRLPEGLRTRDVVRIFCGLGELRTADERSNLAADRIVHLGEEYEVVSVEAWAMTQMPHVEAMAVRVDRASIAVPDSPP